MPMRDRTERKARDAGGTVHRWTLEAAKARFSEVVRRARAGTPQRVTYHGRDAVIVVDAADYDRAMTADTSHLDLHEFLRASGLGDIPVERQRDRGREPPL